MDSLFKKRKASAVIFSPITVLVLTVCLFCGKLFFLNPPVFIFNYSYFIVGSSSMEPSYPVRSFIIVKKESFKQLKTGDVIIFKADALGGGLAFHRITKINEDGLYTKGDANSYGDNQLITEKTYVAKGVYKNNFLGKYLYSVQKPVGFIIYFLLPAFAVWIILKSSLSLVRLGKKL